MSRKSKPTVPPRREGTGRGSCDNSPAGRPCSAFTRWQTGHVRTKVSTFDAMSGHQTMRRAKAMVFRVTAKMPAERGRAQFSEYQSPKFGVRGDAQAITTGTAVKQETGAPQIRGLH